MMSESDSPGPPNSLDRDRGVCHDGNAALDDLYLRLALEAGGLGTWVWHLDTDEVSWSEGLEVLFGLPPGSFEGSFEAFRRRLHPDDRERVLSHIHAVLRDEGEHGHEFRIVRPDGSTRWLESRGQVLRDGRGRPIRMLGVCKDITQQRIEQERRDFLHEATSLLSSSLDTETTLRRIAELAVPQLADWCAIDVCEEGGELRRVAVVHSDPAKLEFARTLAEEYPPDPDQPSGVHQVVRSGVSAHMKRIPGDLLEAAARDEKHLEAIRELGLFSYIVAPLVAEEQVLGALTLVTAESERVLTEDDVEVAESLCNAAGIALLNARLYGDVQRAVRVRDDLLAVVSHDLRNTLQVVTMETSLLREDLADAPEETREGVETMYDASRQMKRLIDDLLDVASIDAGQLSLDREPVEPAAIVARAAEMSESLAGQNEIGLETEVEQAMAPICADADRILQVFLNLVGNALKYTEEGGTITLGGCATAGAVRFWVRDTGRGIPESEQARVFDRYGRGDDTRGPRSVGLGLYICRGIVAAHGGEIGLESDEGQGTTVWFTVPFA